MRFATILLAVVFAGCAREVPPAHDHDPAAHAHEGAPAGAREGAPVRVKYHCPMHPQVESDAPGVCPICGMALVASDAPAAPGGEVTISPAVVQNLGVRTEPAVAGPLERRIETVAYVGFDERRVQQVRARADGWVQGLAVRAIGETVQKGQLLFSLYSPMLDAAQQEYRDAEQIGNRELVDAARDRLAALGITPDAGGKRVPFRAPISGVVTQLEVQEGAMVTAQMPVLTITELGSLWVIAEVPESQSGALRVGAPAEIRFPSLPGQPVAGRLDYVYPELDAETRTVRARITLTDPPDGVRPNMLASVSLGAEAGADVVSIPRSALIRSGREDRVVVALGEGRFIARKVTAGAESGERVAILDGLEAGEQVVVSGQFLLDSEANVSSGLGRLQD